jgi:hypothetical protein
MPGHQDLQHTKVYGHFFQNLNFRTQLRPHQLNSLPRPQYNGRPLPCRHELSHLPCHLHHPRPNPASMPDFSLLQRSQAPLHCDDRLLDRQPLRKSLERQLNHWQILCINQVQYFSPQHDSLKRQQNHHLCRLIHEQRYDQCVSVR